MCGSSWQPIAARLDHSLLTTKQGQTALGFLRTSIMRELLEARYPLTVVNLIERCYPGKEPDSSRTAITATICALRKQIRPLGLRIESATKANCLGAMYVLKELP